MSIKGKERKVDDIKEEERKMLSTQTNSSDPKSLNSRLFIGNIPTEKVTRQEVEEKFAKFGKVAGVSLHRGFAFVQYEHEDDAEEAVKQEHGTIFKGSKIDVNVASLRRREKDERLSRPGGGRRRTPPPYDDRRRREYRERSPHRDSNPLDDRSRRDLSRFSREERFRDDRIRDSFYDNSRRRLDDSVMERRFGSRDEPYKYRRETFADNYPFSDSLEYRYPNDCEIIVPNKQQRMYAEMIEARLKALNLRTDLLFPHEESPLLNVLDDISRRGCLYAVVILPQNETHKSATVNIFWGKPQEHRNMPLDDAMNLIARSFDSYMQSVRDKIPNPAIRDRMNDMAQSSYPPIPMEGGLQILLNLLADGRPLSVPEIDRIIRHLQDKKERLLKDAQVISPIATLAPSQIVKQIDALATTGQLPQDKSAHDQQAELQKRILSILNQNPPSGIGVGVNPNRAPLAAITPGNGLNGNNWADPQLNSSNNSVVNFDNPNVQKALDNLIQSGPALLRTLQATGGPASQSGGIGGHQGPMDGHVEGQVNVNSVTNLQGGGPRSLLSPPGQGQQQIPHMSNNFGMRNPNQQQQRHPLLGTLTPISRGLIPRGNVEMGRF